MTIRILQSPTELQAYDQWVKTHPQGTLWQSVEWKKYQEALGRKTMVYVAEENGASIATALISRDATIGGLCTWDIVRGPLWKDGIEALLQKIIADAKLDRCFSLYISSPLIVPYEALKTQRVAHTRCEQLEATIVIDLMETEEEILAQMHQKGRYNIKLAAQRGVVIQKHERTDQKAIDTFFTLVTETANRDGFTHLSKKQYETFLRTLDESFLMLAWHNDTPVAGLIGINWNGMGIYYYGASAYAHRALMAPALLQWEAVKYCKQLGSHSYDLLGIAPPHAAEGSPWAGITDFKRKFGGTVIEYPAEQEIILKPFAKAVLSMKRKILG